MFLFSLFFLHPPWKLHHFSQSQPTKSPCKLQKTEVQVKVGTCITSAKNASLASTRELASRPESFRQMSGFFKELMNKHHFLNPVSPKKKSSTLSPKGKATIFFLRPMMVHGTWWATSKGSPLSKIRATWRWAQKRWYFMAIWLSQAIGKLMEMGRSHFLGVLSVFLDYVSYLFYRV